MTHIVIVGGGISGLAAAYHLQESGPVECTLIEAGRKFGGKILTEKHAGFIIEAGPDSFISQKPWALELCRKLGLADRLVPTNREQTRTYVYSRGKLRPLPDGVMLMVPVKTLPFLASSLISFPGKLRMGWERFVSARKEEGDESLGAFVRRRLGREALDKIAEPILAGIYAGDAEEMSLDATFPQFRALEREYGSLIRGMKARQKQAHGKSSPWTMFVTLKGGLVEMVDALVAKLQRSRLVCGRRVQSLQGKGGGYSLTLDDGTVLAADAVILATPAYAAADLVDPIDAEIARGLRRIPYVSTATVTLACERSAVVHPLDGFGFVVARNEGRKIMACTWTSTKFPHRAPEGQVFMRCFVGGAGQEHLVDQDDASMIRMVREELKLIMGLEAEPILARVYRWVKANPQFTVGHLDRMAAIEERLKKYPGLYLTGSAYYGVGIPDCIHQGMETARKVAGALT